MKTCYEGREDLTEMNICLKKILKILELVVLSKNYIFRQIKRKCYLPQTISYKVKQKKAYDLKIS